MTQHYADNFIPVEGLNGEPRWLDHFLHLSRASGYTAQEYDQENQAIIYTFSGMTSHEKLMYPELAYIDKVLVVTTFYDEEGFLEEKDWYNAEFIQQ